MTVAFYTLGCKVNQYESRIMAQHFAHHGFAEVEFSDNADVYVINSCTVTATGDKKTRQMVGKIKRLHPTCVCVVCGCYPQAFPEAAAAVEGVDVISGTTDREKLPELVLRHMQERRQVVEVTPHHRQETFEPMSLNQMEGHTRAFVKIQDGCDRFCSYCIIPTARGGLRSKPPQEITQEVAGLVAQGYKEIVLTGINLSSYARESGGDLFEGVVAAREGGAERIRLGSLEPDLTDVFLLDKLAGLDGFCGQFHLAVQSGCDQTLQRMRRRYTAERCLSVASEIRRRFEHPAITGDLIVGFPGESEEEFCQTLEFIAAMKFMQLHVFRFSPRPGTPAALLPDQIPSQEKADRADRATAAAQKGRTEFLQGMIGHTEQVLFERSTLPHYAKGQTKNGATVLVKTPLDLRGQIRQVVITAQGLQTAGALEGIFLR